MKKKEIEQELNLRPVKKLGTHELTNEQRENIKKEVCEHIMQGKTLNSFLKSRDSLPNKMTISNWRKKDEQFNEEFLKCRQIGFDTLAEETLEIIDTRPDLEADGSKIDKGYVFWQRNRIEQRMRLLMKWYPNKYGDKQITEHQGKLSFNVVTNVPKKTISKDEHLKVIDGTAKTVN